ncbi:hypothetical protein, partial [Pseudokineococcus marinus]
MFEARRRDGDEDVAPPSSPVHAGPTSGADHGAADLVRETGRVRSAVRSRALGRVQAVVALEVARSVA